MRLRMIASAAVVSEREAAAAGCAMQESTAMASIAFCIPLTSQVTTKRHKDSFGFVPWVEPTGLTPLAPLETLPGKVGPNAIRSRHTQTSSAPDRSEIGSRPRGREWPKKGQSMRRPVSQFLAAGVVGVLLALSSGSAFAETVAECNADFAANKAANKAAIKASGQTKKDYVAACRAGTAPAMAAPAAAPAPSAAPVATVKTHPTLDGQFLVGFQGWFMCPGDGREHGGWWHWFTANLPDADHVHFDFLPDTAELTAEERCSTDLRDRTRQPIYLFSDQNPKTVLRQFEWMRDYGIDAAALQRFIVDIDPVHPVAGRPAADKVYANALSAAETTGRGFAVMYDIAAADPGRWADVLADDWRRLLKSGATRSPAWQYHRGKPVLIIAGIGSNDRPGTPQQMVKLFQQVRSDSAPYGGVTLVGSTATNWRTLDGDAKHEPEWREVYAALDVISPWTVGRYRDQASFERFVAQRLLPDMAETARGRQDYMPVIFPGFSWANIQRSTGHPPSPLNAIPRNGGRFLWMQAERDHEAGAKMLYGAMFDEVDEGTALFKLQSDNTKEPQQPELVHMDQDGVATPADEYLKLSGKIARMLQQ
jgi:hypothetical protein